MGICLSCIGKCLEDDEPSTYEYTKPLVGDDYEKYNNEYIFEGGGR